MSAQPKTRRIGGRKPRVVISAASLEHLEGLAEGAMARQPDLANRLLDELARARIVSDAKLPDDVVAMGRSVTYRDESTDQEKTVTPVYPEEADIAQGRMSVFTPIGIALLGLAEGASFQWEARDGALRQLTVVAVARTLETHQACSGAGLKEGHVWPGRRGTGR